MKIQTACNIENRELVIDNYLSGNMNNAEAKVFEGHLFHCDSCLSELRLQHSLMQFSQENRNNLENDLQIFLAQQSQRTARLQGSNHRQRWLWLAAAILGLLALILIPYNISKNPPAQQFAENFIPVPHLDNRVDAQIRTQTAFALTNVFPQTNRRFSNAKAVEFHWQFVEDLQPPPSLQLSIVNNREETVYSASVAQTPHHPDQSFSPGIYYWNVQHENELLLVSRFFIQKP